MAAPAKGVGSPSAAKTASRSRADPDTITGLRFTIAAQNGGEALIDFTALRPRRLALAVGRALRQLAGAGRSARRPFDR